MKRLSIDIETFSTLDLKNVGVYKYIECPHFEVLLFAYSVDGGPVKCIDLARGETLPDDVKEALLDPDIIKEAYNTQFERVCLSKYLGVLDAKGQYLNPRGWQCTMALARSYGYHGRLEQVARSLKVGKDKEKLESGNRLIRTFSVPRPARKADAEDDKLCNGKVRTMPDDLPDAWEEFKEYNIRDVVAEMAVQDKLPGGWDEVELEAFYQDQEIVDVGVKVDMDLVAKAVTMDIEYSARKMNALQQLTGLDNPNSLTQLKGWLSQRLGFEVSSVTKDTIGDLVAKAKEIEDKEVIEALRLRTRLSKTSVSKYAKIEETVLTDGMVRGLFQFYGARTGRWAGRLVQVQNLPRNKISDLETARDVVKSGDLELLEMIYPSVPSILSQLIRTAFIPAEGGSFIVVDFSSIEARVLAWVADEKWRLDVFQSHGRIYEASASAMFGVPLDEITKDSPLRQKGKVAELALGYQGAAGALIQMGALDMGLTEEELPGLVSQWRKANPNIVQFWADVDRAVKEAIVNKGVARLKKGLIFDARSSCLYITLPSGRRLAYPNARLGTGRAGYKSIIFDTIQGFSFGPEETYGGKLTENIVQAIARDCLRDFMLELKKQGRDTIVMHIHDEIVVDTGRPHGGEDEPDEARLARIEALMGVAPDWAPGLPLGGDGFVCKFYQKD